MKKTKKILSMFLALVMLVGMALPVFAVDVPTGTVDANNLQDTKPTTTTVNIYKLQADSYAEGAPWNHTGGKIDDVTSLGTNVKGLDGVVFTVYKLKTEQDLKALEDAALDTKDTTEAMTKNHSTKIETTTALDPTANGGLATTNLGEGFYWIVETKPSNVSSAVAVPFGLSLPMKNPYKVGDNIEAGTKYFNTLYIYPKNVTGDNPVPDKTVDSLTNKLSSHDVGETVKWYLQATVPGNIQDYKVFKMHDKFSTSLSYIGNVVVKYGNGTDFDKLGLTLTETTDYIITQPAAETKGGELTIALTENGIKKLADSKVENGKLVAKVETKINEDAIMGVEIENGYDLTFSHDPNNEGKPVPSDHNPKVITGGKLFKKVDGLDKKALEGAIFELYDGQTQITWTADLIKANEAAIKAGKFAKNDAPDYTATAADTDVTVGDPIYLRADKDGLFEIKGLEFSKWQHEKWDETQGKFVPDGNEVTHDWNIKEIKAPEGYALLDDVVKFVVDKNSYYNNPTEVAQTPANPQEVENKKLTIPQTGGIGTVIFAVVGIGLMAGAVVAMKRREAND